MPTIPTFAAALNVLKTQLAPLSSDTALRIDDALPAPFVDVVRLSEEPTSSDRNIRAAVVLSGSDERAPEWGFTARRATVLATCAASEFAGALETPTRAPIHETLSNALQGLIESNYVALRDAGLLANSARRIREGVTGLADDAPIHFVDVEITFVFLTQ